MTGAGKGQKKGPNENKCVRLLFCTFSKKKTQGEKTQNSTKTSITQVKTRGFGKY